jgi:hypothetical protein
MTGKNSWYIVDGYRPPAAEGGDDSYEGHECIMTAVLLSRRKDLKPYESYRNCQKNRLLRYNRGKGQKP